ncbi:aminotransferase class V-fold PLP-dependent enzyme [Kribbella solani]|uniref:L-seryl-tRNA(Ser) seleniumtransferase n=1 Tax=Kribbella solani TaxID=236067 RepID=A0A841E0L1_9ACTN|nr:aminotransferase class V-fold PLP-dependent enzyme [Kribbella solani]MBB5980958.1 L-seryl-tRNA(Ser) seleniumtransferase [Kribbella solani]MDX2974055.1 aminotransferase class V-fold PLP-dependent enzyme [Kribbella solani]MDX3003523.1 aminotransferase class V-fold PLP-dependent enzyme [Kribbella solani]
MSIHDRYRLSVVINAKGTYTPLGVYRSPDGVAAAVAQALPEFFVMDELGDRASEAIAQVTGAQAGAVVHCTAAGVTLSVAATMTGGDPRRISTLPDTSDLHNRVVLPASHVVDYGHTNLQGIRLSGAQVDLAGSADGCTIADLEAELDGPDVACLMLVASRLTRGEPIDLVSAIRAAHRRGVPAIIDAAAQFPRIADLLATGADLVLVSGQKYLGSPTAGIVAGSWPLVQAVRAQEKGIGRVMKPSKEAIVGVLAALEEWQAFDRVKWEADELAKVDAFVAAAGRIPDLTAEVVPDPTGLQVSRVLLKVPDAKRLATELEAGTPPIYVMTDRIDDNELMLELVPLSPDETATILAHLWTALT